LADASRGILPADSKRRRALIYCRDLGPGGTVFAAVLRACTW